MTERIVYLATFDGGVSSLFPGFTPKVINDFSEMRNSPNGILVFNGGEDIATSLYDERPNGADAGYEMSARDSAEYKMFNYATLLEMPILGICRGSQFVCACSGGKLYQHVEGHLGSHNIQTTTHGIIEVTSTHHQMMRPEYMPKKEYQVLAWADIYGEQDPEVVYFKRTGALAIQGHPEYNWATPAFKQYAKDMINKYLVERLDK